MSIKMLSEQAGRKKNNKQSKEHDHKDLYQEAGKMADKLANKPYGKKKQTRLSPEEIKERARLKREDKKRAALNELVRTTVLTPRWQIDKAQDVARRNNRNKVEPSSVSAILREALDYYLKTL